MGKLCRGVHENIIEIYGYGELRNSTYHYIDMQLCLFDLKEYLDHRGSKHSTRVTAHIPLTESPWLNSEEVFSIMEQIANGVEFIHGHREVHRDLKPRNGGYYHVIELMHF